MAHEVSKSMGDEDDRLVASMSLEATEELKFALRIQRGRRLVCNEQSYVSTHEPHECSRAESI